MKATVYLSRKLLPKTLEPVKGKRNRKQRPYANP